MAKSAVKQAEVEALRETAATWLADQAHNYLLKTSEPVKTREILRGIGVEGVSLKLIKHVLSASSRFEQLDRKWSLSARYQDPTRPTERIINLILTSCGRPMMVEEIAGDLAAVYGRPIESMDQTASRMLAGRESFFEAEPGRYGSTSWLVHPTSNSEEDVLFDNFMDESDVSPYRAAAEKAFSKGELDKSVEAFLKTVGRPVSIKCVLFFIWKANPEGYDPKAAYAALVSAENLIFLSDQRLALTSSIPAYNKALVKLAETIEEVEEEAEEPEEPQTVEFTDADKEEAVKLILDAESATRAEDIIEPILDISPGERAFETALEQLICVLREDERVIWVGWDQWMPTEALPDFVCEIPPSLVIPPVHPFETFEGEIHDQILEEEGLAGPLKKEIFNPLAMDVTDDDVPEGGWDWESVPARQRCVLTYHHKVSGTFPLCQIHPESFPSAPSIMRITLTDEGIRREAWVNRDTHLIYGLGEWFENTPISGAVFYLEPARKSGEVRFIYDGETDPLVHIPEGRLLELLEIKDDPQVMELSTFELITRIMAGQRNSAEFITLLTEVNLIRRVPRRLVASIISSYHCFRQRAKTMIWLFDEKIVSQGFEKNKRKYLRKELE